MANSLSNWILYLPQVLDEAIAKGSVTSIFDTPNDSIIPTDIAGEYKIMKMDFGNGLGNYARATGFKAGQVKTEWETVKLTQDRATSFSIDNIDDAQAGKISAQVLNAFLKAKVIPEVDAYRITKYASAIPSTNLIEATDTWTASTAYTAFQDAIDKLFNLGVDNSDMVLLCTAAFRSKLIEKVGVNRFIQGQVADYRVSQLDGVSIIPVPESRFYDSITTSDYSASGTGGGFVPTTGGYGMNFILAPRSYVNNITQHNRTRVFTPDQNQSADAYKLDYRLFYDAFVLDNKKPGLVGCKKKTAVV